MISLSLRASLALFAATWFAFGPGPVLSAQSVDCTSTTCAPLTTCVGCPTAAPLTFQKVIAPRDLGQRFNAITIDTFPDAGVGALGALQRAELKFTISPEQIRFRVENLATTTAVVSAINPTYDVAGYIDVLDPLFPPISNVALVRTSDKVEGLQGSSGCLKWRVTGNLSTQFGGSGTLPPFDNCYDFNDPDQAPLPIAPGVPSPCLGSAHGGPCDLQLPDVLPGTCCPDLLLHPLIGRRVKMGRGVSSDGTCPDLGILDPGRSGFTDVRNFNGFTGVTPYVSTGTDDYIYTVCFTDAAHLNYFRQSNYPAPAPAFVPIPLKTEPNTIFPGIQSSDIDIEELVKIGIKVEVKYFYCPPPPVCAPDTANVCRTLGAMTSINVLANDTPTPGAAPLGGLNCALLAGTLNLTQGTYGTAQWINDPACVNTACNQRCIKYTLTSLPPLGVNTDTINYTIVGNNGCFTSCTATVTIAAPVCAPDTGDVCRAVGSQATVNVLANDTSFRPLNCALLTGSTGIGRGLYGTAAWVDGGCANALCNGKCLRYTLNTLPPVGVTTDTVTYTITDTNGCPSTCTVTITIASPVCAPDTGNLCRQVGSMATVNVLANDTSMRPLNCALLTGTTGVTQGAFGSVAWVTDAAATNALCNQKALKYTLTSLPPIGTTTDSFNYTITDTNGCTSVCTVTLTVASPVCVPDTADVCRTAGSMTNVNVLANDTSLRPLNCGLLTGTTGLTQGTFGTVQWLDGGCANALCNGKCVKYTLNTVPPLGTNTDTFTYTITDTFGCTSTCTVTVTIASPVCVPDTANLCRAVGQVANINVLANDTSLRPLNCGLLVRGGGLTQGTFGTVAWVDGGCANALCNGKCVRYTLTSLPPVGTNTDSFSYTITDTSGCTSTCTVTVTIAAPVCAPDVADVCRTVGSFTNTNVLTNDISFRPLNCGLLTGTGGLTQGTFGSTAWVNDAAATNGLCNQKAVRYTLTSLPPAGVTTDTYTYTITDSFGCTSTCTVTVTIASPVCAADCADVCATIGAMATINVLANDVSPRPLNCALLTGAGGLTQGTYGSVAWVAASGCSNALCTGKCVKYTVTSLPPNGVNMDTFTYTITDTNGCPSTCTVQVKFCKLDAVNDGPLSTCQGVPFRICVLDNDTSTCGLLGCSNLSILTGPANGSVQIIQDCANLPTSCQTPIGGCTGCCLVYTPNTGFFGTETFTYRITTTSTGCPGGTPITCTDTATVTIVVKPSPTAVDDNYQLTMNGTVGPFDVRDNDSPGNGCEFTGCGGACVFVSCPEITQQPLHGTLSVDPVTCKVTYTATPGVVFPGSDTFCYRVVNNCGCCDTACVTISECPMIDRNQPGSLLLYPEFDNRPGRTTYVTITNSSCQWPSAGVFVEFVYIDKENCLETNRTTFLTACDTYTVVTSAHNPNPSRGFMYAFAKDALGRPISFNYLIGDLLIADGVDGHQYSVVPVAFRSPVARGGFTDLDGDDIRDLNGFEYDQAPDTLLIPRFLGQDPPGSNVFQSELVVLGLSGGVSFQTVVSIIGFNDNEVPFFVTKQFYCWEKWKLTDISNAFTNTYLQNSGDDPLEIIGNPARESGWFRIDGLTAFSDIETIIDPAIYAFLVERHVTADRGAELPFEVCAQSNGDLQAKSPLGDGPVPVAGDNQ